MRRAIPLLLAFLCLHAGGTELYVSCDGADSNDGSIQSPFASLERARDAVRTLIKSKPSVAGPITITVQSGIYYRTHSFKLDSTDSGAASRPILWRANGDVHLHAGKILGVNAFGPVTDEAVRTRLDASARSFVLKLDLAAVSARNIGPFPPTFNDGGGLIELFQNNVRMPLSRWPNEGNATMERVLDRGESRGPSRHGGTFIAREDRVLRWSVENGVWLEGYWRVPWDPQSVRVKSIDPASRQIVLAEPVSGGIGSKYAKAGELGDGKEPWCAVNLLEEIDRPGEWCVDFNSKTLYFWPPQAAAGSTIYVSDIREPVISVQDASFITLQGFTIEGGLGNGVEIVRGTANRIVGCTFRNLGGKGAVVSGFKNGVLSSDFHDLGEGGIYLSGGNRKTLEACSNFAGNNHLWRLGMRRKTYAAGIHIENDSVGCVVSHNLIHDLPHAGILYQGNDNVLEFNEIYRVVLTSGDMGAFYTTHDWTSYGNVVRYNFVYDSERANAFYADDGDSGDIFFGNVVHGCFYGPFIGGGHDNTVRNNLILSCERGLHIDDRGVARGYANDRNLRSRLDAIQPDAVPWSAHYPELEKFYKSEHRDLPSGNRVLENVTANCRQSLHFSAKKEHLALSTISDNVDLGTEDPGCIDSAHCDFSLKPDSAVFKKLPSFQPIPFAKIGLYCDEFRKSLPARTLTHGQNKNSLTAFDSETDVQQTNSQNGVH